MSDGSLPLHARIPAARRRELGRIANKLIGEMEAAYSGASCRCSPYPPPPAEPAVFQNLVDLWGKEENVARTAFVLPDGTKIGYYPERYKNEVFHLNMASLAQRREFWPKKEDWPQVKGAPDILQQDRDMREVMRQGAVRVHCVGAYDWAGPSPVYAGPASMMFVEALLGQRLTPAQVSTLSRYFDEMLDARSEAEAIVEVQSLTGRPLAYRRVGGPESTRPAAELRGALNAIAEVAATGGAAEIRKKADSAGITCDCWDLAAMPPKWEMKAGAVGSAGTGFEIGKRRR